MSEKLILASDARKAILNIDPKYAYCIDSIPAVDAVKVVRCKDCKQFGKCSIYDIGNFNRYDFCSYGERRCDNG